MVCARFGHRKIASMLVARNANVNASDSEGSTALMCACEMNIQTVAEMLLDNGANVEATDNVTTKGRRRRMRRRRGLSQLTFLDNM
jgi:ankyrin repeat protein